MPAPRGSIRSFSRRSGRMTRGQRGAIHRYWPTYGVESDSELDLDQLFGRRAPRDLEIGFGMGHALIDMASAHPERDYLGIDVYEPGIGATLAAIAEHGLTNVRLMRGDANVLVAETLPPRSLASVMIFFPDPWPKKRHHKRRLVQPEFVRLIGSRLAPGGTLHLATDWEEYALHMLCVLEASEGFVMLGGEDFRAAGGGRPRTKFERRGERLGHRIWDLHFAWRGEH
ncbi:MAG: tRNA (guanosine(46)-N7)-methyltransferase TrmB [Gammaproteobacteria bacterium]|nr:tRNA (guanosine(46)-N7)-methyltransferase TrmB [Gammaproteobacteria bacterium]